jgi:cell division protein FtsQ
VQTVREARFGEPTFLGALDHALGRVLRPLANLLPRRLRRAAEKIERDRRRRTGQMAAAGFLIVTLLYALTVGGQIGRLADSILVAVGFGIEDVEITGENETSQIAVLEKLEIGGSLISFDARKAQQRLAELPWVERVVVRKFYPSTLSVEITERKPFALWQRDGNIVVIDRSGTAIVPLEEGRFAKLPLMVGGGANQTAPDLLGDLLAEPSIVAQMRAAVLVAGRRWDLHLDHGVTVKLPEKNVRQALAELVKLDAEEKLLSRDVVVVDMRLPDRVTVRLPEGRSLDDVTSDGAPPLKQGKTRT